MRATGFLLTAAAGLLAVPTAAQAAPKPSVPSSAGVVKAGVDAWSRGEYDAAVKAWQGPADAGDADAQFNLAQAFKMGRGVPQDMVRAQEYYRRAALQGHLQASDNYGLLLFQNGQREQAMPFITASAERGEPRAQYVLGIASFNGDLAAKDWVRAYALMSRSAASGLPQAVQALAAMDKSIPLNQRQMGVSLAGELEARAEETRGRALASADLGVTGPLRTAQPAAPVASTPIPPSSAAVPVVVTSDAPGADFANAPPPPKRVVGSYISGAPVTPAPGSAPVAAPPPKPAAPKPAATKVVAALVRPVPQAAAPAPAAGRWRIQLGAFGQKGNADALWSKVRGNRALAGRSRFDVSAGAVTRLQAGPFASEADARAACAALGGQCVPVRP